MLDDFFIRALIAGMAVAAIAGPMGCFIVWRKLAYFGDTLAHAALLGVALGLLLDVNNILSVFVVSVLTAGALLVLQKRSNVSSDAILGLLSHATLAVGLISLAFISWIQVELESLLFGDILSVSVSDITVILIGGALVLLILAWIWNPLFAASVNRDLAEAEGAQPDRANIIFMLLMSLVIALALKIVGALLITSLLIIPAATARQFARSPEQMGVMAALIGILAVVSGLFGSLHWDTPSGPSIVVAAFVLFLAGLLARHTLKRNAT